MKFIKVLILLLLTTILVLPLIFLQRIIKIRNIECLSQYGPCEESLLVKLQATQNKSLKDCQKFITLELENNIVIEDFSYQYKVPDRLFVNIILKKSVFALKSVDFGIYGLVENDGLVIEIKKDSNLPTVEILGKLPNIGENVGKEKLSALMLVNDIFSLFNVKTGKIVGKSLEITLPDGIIVVFPLDRDRQILLGALKLIIDRLNSEKQESKIDIGKVRVIDLRFANPVLR